MSFGAATATGHRGGRLRRGRWPRQLGAGLCEAGTASAGSTGGSRTAQPHRATTATPSCCQAIYWYALASTHAAQCTEVFVDSLQEIISVQFTSDTLELETEM